MRANDTYNLTEVEELDNIAWDWIRKASQYYVVNNEFCYYKWNKLQLFSDGAVWSGQNILRQYNENDFYEWHGDQSPTNLSEFSYIIYLNDDFDGGDTKFLNDKIRVSPKKGSVLCFPVDRGALVMEAYGGLDITLISLRYTQFQMILLSPFDTFIPL